MKTRLFRIFSIVTILALLLNFNGGLDQFIRSSTARAAAGDLLVDWGVTAGNPIFVITNWAPGGVETRSVQVSNTSPTARTVGVRGVKDSETNNLSQAVDFVISSSGGDIYGGTTGSKTLAQFFTDSSSPDGIFLSNLNANQTTTYSFKATFLPQSGNAFQNSSVVFDLIIGIAIDLPAECDNLNLSATPIIGSSRAERLRGTPDNELIMGLEGADNIDGGGGDDCILGGTGADRMEGGSGHDALFGEEGSDNMDGGAGNDYLNGAGGADTMDGGSGQDKIIGGIGSDKIDGGSNDDYIEGNDAADDMKGGSGNDTLLGGAASDRANGDSGMDTCEAERKTSCELP